MKAPLTPDELRRAWEAMRRRPALRDWPADFDQVMGDTTRAQCVAIEATAARHRAETPTPVFFGMDLASGPDKTAYWRPSCRGTPNLFDRKRAAANDTGRDDD